MEQFSDQSQDTRTSFGRIYKVGVYCDNPRIGKVAGSRWMKFEVIAKNDFKISGTGVQSKEETKPQKDNEC